MNKLHIIKFAILVVTIMLFSACSGSSGSSSSASKVNFTVNFVSSGATGTASKAATSQITSIVVEAIPGSSASATDSTTIPVSNGVIQQSANFTALTDNETYLFRITAYDAGSNIIYTGQTVQTLAPGNNNVSITCYGMNGFSTAATTYSVTTSNGTNQVFTINASGTSTWNSGQNLLFLSATATPSVFRTDIILRDSLGNLSAVLTNGTISTAQTTTPNTGYSVSRFTAGMSEQYTVASGYRGMVLNTDGKDTIYGLQSITTNLPAGLVDLSYPLNLATNSTTDYTPRSIVSNGNGQYLITWSEYAAPNYLVKGRFFNQDISGLLVAPGNEFLIDSSTNPGDDAPLVAFDGTNFLVVWSRDMGGSFNIYGRFVSATTGPLGSAITFSAGPPGDTSDLALTYIPSTGNYYLTNSYSMDSINYNYYISSCDTAGNLTGGPTQINTTTSLSSNPTSIAFDGTNLLVTMPIYTIDDTIGHLYARRITTGLSPIGAEIQIATGITRKFGGFPSFYANSTTPANSYYLVTYTDFGTSSATFYGQKIDTNGTLIGSPFIIANNAAFGSCSYSTQEGAFRCIYNGYSTYVQSISSMLGNLTSANGRAILP